MRDFDPTIRYFISYIPTEVTLFGGFFYERFPRPYENFVISSCDIHVLLLTSKTKLHHITVENGEVIVEMVRSRHGLLNFPILNLKYYCYLTLTPYFFIFFEIYEARVLLRWWDCFSELPTLLYLFVWPSVTPIFQDLHRFRGQ